MGILVYTSSVSASIKIRKETARIQAILNANNVDFTEIDVAVDDDAKNFLKSKSEKPGLALPQIWNDEKFCGLAIENLFL